MRVFKQIELLGATRGLGGFYLEEWVGEIRDVLSRQRPVVEEVLEGPRGLGQGLGVDRVCGQEWASRAFRGWYLDSLPVDNLPAGKVEQVDSGLADLEVARVEEVVGGVLHAGED